MNKTPILDHDEKLDIMEHLNQDHMEELLVVASYYGTQTDYTKVKVTDIFEEGVLLETVNQHEQQNQEYVPFSIQGSLEEKVLYLAYYALTKKGEYLENSRRKFFEVGKKSMPSKNIMRIDIKSLNELPKYYAGYAYGIVLKNINSPEQRDPYKAKKGFFMKIFDHLFLWLLRRLSSKNRMKLVKKMNRDIRLYTLRFSRIEPSQHHYLQGAIDIYLHGDSPGGSWVRGLKEGDIIFSRTESKDRHQHLQQGKNILIADETAFPALAGILELWRNPVAPIVLVLMADSADKFYFKDVQMPEGTEVHYLQYEAGKQAKPVVDILKQIQTLDGAWGALERDAAKEIRHYVRNTLSVEGGRNHIKGYWAK